MPPATLCVAEKSSSVDHAARAERRDAFVRGLEVVRIEDVQVERGMQDEQRKTDQEDDETQVSQLVRKRRFPEPEFSSFASHFD